LAAFYRHARASAGRQDECVGGLPLDEIGGHLAAHDDAHACAPRLMLEIGDDPAELGASGQKLREQHLSAETAISLMQGHGVATLGCDGGGRHLHRRERRQSNRGRERLVRAGGLVWRRRRAFQRGRGTERGRIRPPVKGERRRELLGEVRCEQRGLRQQPKRRVQQLQLRVGLWGRRRARRCRVPRAATHRAWSAVLSAVMSAVLSAVHVHGPPTALRWTLTSNVMQGRGPHERRRPSSSGCSACLAIMFKLQATAILHRQVRRRRGDQHSKRVDAHFKLTPTSTLS
jgi:hypothetical protein